MKGLGRHIQETKWFLFAQALAGYCSVLLFTFLMLVQSSVALSSNVEENAGIRVGLSVVHASDIRHGSHDPFNIPTSPEPKPESSTEKEDVDTSEDDSLQWSMNDESAEYFLSTNTRNAVSSFITSFQNCPKRSLYVLHHCWKTCIA